MRDSTIASWAERAAGCALILLLVGCVQPPAAPAASASAPIASGLARIWFYRDFEPSVSLNQAQVELNGRTAGYVQPDGSAFYRDVPPGRHHITVVSFWADVNQAKDLDIGPGQEAFVKILAGEWAANGGDLSDFHRDAFYVSLVPPQVARAQLANRPATGG